jgi:6-phosphogluconolactonase/glucosamine-6-phosphate isomerase/deaminase
MKTNMTAPTIHTSDTATEAAQALATTLAADVDGRHDVLLLLAGGSSLNIIDHLPDFEDASFLTISVIDERDDRSGRTGNFSAIEGTDWFRAAISRGASFIDPLHPIDAPKETKASSFEQAIRKWKEAHPDSLTVAILGTKPDGHTAGIFPLPDAGLFAKRFSGKAWVIAHTVPHALECPDRITVTLSFLQKETDAVYCYICGEGKREALTRAMDGKMALNELPIGIIRTLQNVQIFTDIRL